VIPATETTLSSQTGSTASLRGMTAFHTLDADWRRLDDDLTVLRGRTERLLALGYELREAAFLAISQIDIGELERLIGKGCPRETAVRITA
jgi:hypothetical protein